MGRRPILQKEQVLTALQRWAAEHGRAPSLEELRKELRVGSTRTIFRYLQMLQEDGAIETRSGVPGIKLLKPRSVGVETRAIPIVGQVAAGAPMLADENIDGWIRVPKSFVAPERGRFFFLHVRGNSMNKARVGGDRIEGGDLVLVRQQQVARSNDIVIALIDGEATVKRFVEAEGYGVLKPESTEAKHEPILVDDEFRVLGVVTRVLKKGSKMLRNVFEERN